MYCYHRPINSLHSISRFTNILPYDHTLLKLNEPIEDCSYVNATWITSATQQPFDVNENTPLHSISKISFFSSQGPLPRTIPHHLQMIHEQRPIAVVMLTKFEEGPADGIAIFIIYFNFWSISMCY